MSNGLTSENSESSDLDRRLTGRLLSLDLGEKRVGVAVSDELLVTVRPLPLLRGTNWKELLRSVHDLVRSFDAKGLVIGLPLNFDGSEGRAAQNARQRARNFHASLHLPVYLQDERLTTRESEETLRAAGVTNKQLRESVDSQAAVLILRDFIDRHRSR